MAGEVRFAEVRRILESHGWELAWINGSHHYFKKPGQKPIAIPVHHNRVKPVYVRKAEKLIESEKKAGPPSPA